MKIWILWATWAVWVEMIKCLHDMNIPVSELRLLASSRSAWKSINTPFWDIIIKEATDQSFEWLDFVLFSAWWDNSKKFAQPAINAWAIVIDNSSAFRYDPYIPLVIPEINPHTIWDARLIANPNCTTAIASVVLYPLHREFTLKKVIVSTYQATSWAWAKGIDELLRTTKDYFENKESKNEIFIHPIAFNLIPQIDKFQENWYTKEEMKMVWETHKIFWDKSIAISCTAVRIPTLRAHSESITIETEKQITPELARNILERAWGVDVVDEPKKNLYPMPITSSGKYFVEVWRIRQNLIFGNYWLDLFVSWDQLLKGAALNAVQILEYMIKNK